MNIPDYLPPFAVEIADVIGLDGLMRLVKHFGGTAIRVPGRGNLKQVLTAEQYKDFVQTFRNEEICIPRLQEQLNKIALAETHRLLEQGYTKAEVARELQLTERGVYKRQAKYRKQQDDKQQELF